MTIAQSVYKEIEHIRPGKLFSYRDIGVYSDHSEAVVKAVNRNVKKLGLIKVKKGLFYKAEVGRFGPMAPRENDVIQYFTQHKSRTVGYVTGPALYYRWGLTTQVPAEVNVATAEDKREKANLSGLRLTTSPARYKRVTKTNIELLQFLDVLNHIERIPDANVEDVSNKLGTRLKRFPDKSIAELEDIAIKAYAERTKALLGMFMERYKGYFSDKLQKSLNPTSTFYFSNADKVPNAKQHWHLTINK
ncbi:DUF6088 family protein [Glaciecola siphonariae]|uniref:DUF6088 family protein n=1 Tax=Glaciecola siphonariae TaxID=521012 RepID=A0ABV9LZ48_9ALTE